jgi:hypothetical protein
VPLQVNSIPGSSGQLVTTPFRNRTAQDNPSYALSYLLYDWLRSLGLRPNIDSVFLAMNLGSHQTDITKIEPTHKLQNFVFQQTPYQQVFTSYGTGDMWMPPAYAQTSPQGGADPIGEVHVSLIDLLNDPRALKNHTDPTQDSDELALAFGNVLHSITYPPTAAKLTLDPTTGELITQDGKNFNNYLDFAGAFASFNNAAANAAQAAEQALKDYPQPADQGSQTDDAYLAAQQTVIDNANTQIATDNTNKTTDGNNITNDNNQITTDNNKISQLDPTSSTYQTDLNKLNTDIANMNTDIGKQNTDINNLNSDITTQQGKIDTANKNMKAIKIRKRAKAVDANGQYLMGLWTKMYNNLQVLTGEGLSEDAQNAGHFTLAGSDFYPVAASSTYKYAADGTDSGQMQAYYKDITDLTVTKMDTGQASNVTGTPDWLADQKNNASQIAVYSHGPDTKCAPTTISHAQQERDFLMQSAEAAPPPAAALKEPARMFIFTCIGDASNANDPNSVNAGFQGASTSGGAIQMIMTAFSPYAYQGVLQNQFVFQEPNALVQNVDSPYPGPGGQLTTDALYWVCEARDEIGSQAADPNTPWFTDNTAPGHAVDPPNWCVNGASTTNPATGQSVTFGSNYPNNATCPNVVAEWRLSCPNLSGSQACQPVYQVQADGTVSKTATPCPPPPPCAS